MVTDEKISLGIGAVGIIKAGSSSKASSIFPSLPSPSPPLTRRWTSHEAVSMSSSLPVPVSARLFRRADEEPRHLLLSPAGISVRRRGRCDLQ